MKNYHKLLIAGSILTVVFACQPKNPRAPAADMSAQEQPTKAIPSIEKEDEDIDLHVYGTNDTSTSFDTEVTIEPESVIADIHEVLENTIQPVTQAVEGEVVVLEAVNPVEVTPEFQEN